MYIASMYVRPFVVAKPGATAEILDVVGVRGWIIAALLEEVKDLKLVASFESCEMELRYSTCIGRGSWRSTCGKFSCVGALSGTVGQWSRTNGQHGSKNDKNSGEGGVRGDWKNSYACSLKNIV